MKAAGQLNYGNWVPVKIVYIFLVTFCITCIITVLVNAFVIKIIFACISVILGLFLVYMGYAYWLIGKNNGELLLYVANYLQEDLKKSIINNTEEWKIRYKKYDLTLNDEKK